MATPQLSPGVLVREVDLTVGRADNVLDNIGAIAGPFAIGPVDQPIDITTEKDLINVFGKPLSQDGQYEYWMSASSYLSYGGVLKVVRTDGDTLVNANSSRNGSVLSGLKIRNYDDYNTNYTDNDSVTWGFAAKTPGTWANNLKVCLIDDKADQTLSGISTTEVTNTFFVGVTTVSDGDIASTTNFISGITTDSGLGILAGQTVKAIPGIIDSETIVTDVGVGTVFLSKPTLNTISLDNVELSFGSYSTEIISTPLYVGYGVTQSLSGVTNPGIGTTSVLDGYLKGIITGIGNSSIDVKVTSYVSGDGTETSVDYQQNGIFAFSNSGNVALHTSGQSISYANASYDKEADWYDEQLLGLDNSIIYWKSIAPKPTTNRYSLERSGKNDALHVVVIDDVGSVTGVQGNLLEKHLFLSKSKDAVSAQNAPQRIFWKDYLGLYSSFVYAGDNPSDGNDGFVAASGFSSGFTGITTADGLWNQEAQGITYNVIGNTSYNLTGGQNYDVNGGYSAQLSRLITSYQLFESEDQIQVDYLIMGPGLGSREDTQAKANYLISLATQRKDCMAVISPYRGDLFEGTDLASPILNTETQTNNILAFYSPLPSSSYAVFDNNYKYTYDRFNNKFRWIACNPDIAGLMVRTSIVAYPWFSPAGQQRGILNNAIKLASNTNKNQRDKLYAQRVNTIISQPGIGILLYGDKTGLGYASAFDRINVRRLFLTIEQALRKVAQAQLFEINDEFTRANFRNAVEPYLRDVEAKRGLYGSLVVCDTSNNTPDVIDNNEFRADIYLKPTKSINYITLTFVATRTGISFEEVAGTV